MQVTDEVLERATRLLNDMLSDVPWEKHDGKEQNFWRNCVREALETVLPEIVTGALGQTLPDGRRLVGQMWVCDDGKNEYRIVGGTGLDRARLAREFAGLLFQWLTELCELIKEAEAAQGGDEDADDARDD